MRTILISAVSALIGAGALHSVLTRTEPLRTALPATQSTAEGTGLDFAAMDTNVAACSDFYQRACGGFIMSSHGGAPGAKVSLSDRRFDAQIDANLTRLFAQKAPSNSELGRLKAFYSSCLMHNVSNFAVIKHWLGEIDTAESAPDFQALIRSLSGIGVDPFFSYSGQPDPHHLRKYRGEIDASDLWQSPAVVEQTFTLVGISPSQAKRDAEAVATIVAELHEHRPTGTDLADYENPRSWAQLQQIAPAIDWASYSQMVAARPDRLINLTSANYLPAVSHLLATRSPTEIRAYLRWALLFSLRGELPPPYDQAFADITPTLRVAVSDPTKRCRDATVRGMGVEFSRQYSERVLGISARTTATSIAKSIRDQIVESVRHNTWLSPGARRTTAAKLTQTDLKIGFPDHWPAVGNFPIDPSRFLDNVISAREFEARRAWGRANLPRSRKDWDMLVAPWVGTGMAAARLVVPNGFPDPYTNSLIMTAAFLTPPRFNASAPDELNYATFGAVFAHEFVHVAETHGFGANGAENELWAASDITAANRQHQCVVDQADAYKMPSGVKMSGRSNYDENVADLGGLRLAYGALAAKLGSRMTKVDGHGMTPAKRFFYKFAQNYCSAATKADLEKLAADDPHALPSYRVNGPLSNLPAFGAAFGCTAGSPMRRVKANSCRVW